MKRVLFAFLSLFPIVSILFAQNPPTQGQPKQLPTIAEKTEGMQRSSGFFTDYWDSREGKLWLRVDKWNTCFLFHESLPNGVGSNDIGLDRGQPGRTFVVHFERSGPRVLLVAENQEYRAVTEDPEQQRAVREAFAQSILWGSKVEAVDGDAVLVDATDFFLSDVHQAAASLAKGKQGRYRVDLSRSAIYLPRTRNFPENTDVESTLSLVSEDPSELVRTVTPDPRAVTVHEHFSFIQAPPAGFHGRPFDPRSGYFGISYMDFASPELSPQTFCTFPREFSSDRRQRVGTRSDFVPESGSADHSCHARFPILRALPPDVQACCGSVGQSVNSSTLHGHAAAYG
jgi:hypothetical protein